MSITSAAVLVASEGAAAGGEHTSKWIYGIFAFVVLVAALFVVTRHRQHLAFGHGVVESVALATHSAGRSVLFAGVTVVISMLGLTLVGIPLIASMGVAVAITVSVAVLVSVLRRLA